MSHEITRREFIDGVLCLVAAGAASGARGADPKGTPYPPELTGFRGSREPDYRIAHAVRDGEAYSMEAYPVSEEVDYVVVGAGIGGLSAAYYLRELAPSAGVLILDNHDDFGGHARRNEFDVDGRFLIGYGGSESIEAPRSSWTPNSLHLLKELGIHLDRFHTAFHQDLYPRLGMSLGHLFRREVYGVDKLVVGDPQRDLPTDTPAPLAHSRRIEDFAQDCPLTDSQRRQLVALFKEQRDCFPGKSATEKREILSKLSYADFLVKCWGVDPPVLDMYLGRTLDLFGLSADFAQAIGAAITGYPGFQGMGFKPNADSLEPYIYHFPDGNASIARLLVRKLIPRAASGHSMEDIVTTRFAYDELDRDNAATRLRLSSTVVRLANDGTRVNVLYAGPEGIRRVSCRNVIYAGYETMLPYICGDIPQAQRQFMAGNVKAPFVYINVALRNWRAWVSRQVHAIINPTGFYCSIKLDYPVSLGTYQFAKTPDEPILVHLVHVPRAPSHLSDCRASLRAARTVLYGRTFAEFETAARDELTRALGTAGFDADRDIAAITVNRWGHGYAFDPNALAAPDAPRNLVTESRRPVGRISIAGSDAAWDAIAYAAIDEARRAVNEVLQ